MAVTDELSATTQYAILPVAVDNFAKATPTIVALIKNLKFLDGGLTLRQPTALLNSGLSQTYSGGDALSTAFNNDFVSIELPWVQYGTTISITGRDDMINSGRAAILNLVSLKVSKYEVELREKLATDLIQNDGASTTDAKGLTGFIAAIDDSTNITTYGGLSRSTYTNLKAIYSANSGTGRAVTLSLIQTNFGSASKGNTKPNVIITTQGVVNKITTLYQPNQRFIDEASYASAGFSAIGYQNRPIIVDDLVQTSPNHRIYGVNTEYMFMAFHRQRFFRWVNFMRWPNQDAATAMILLACQLVCQAPRLQFQIVDLDPTL